MISGYFFSIKSDVPSIEPLSIIIISNFKELRAFGIDSRQRYKYLLELRVTIHMDINYKT